jgi:tetratricopeptide (TPR) repeat protein
MDRIGPEERFWVRLSKRFLEIAGKYKMDSLTDRTQRVVKLPSKGYAPGARIRGWVAWCGLLAAVLGSAAAQGQPAASQVIQQEMREGAEAMSAGNFSAAAEAYSAVVRGQPDFAEGYFNLGLAMQQAGRLDEARTALEKSLRLKPGLRGANLFLGIIDYRQNRYGDAESSLLRETRIDPRSAKAWMWLGVCYLAQDEPQDAIAPLDRAYALDPSDVDILYHRGHAYLLVANASYAAMFKADHDSMRVHQVMAEAYATGFRTQEAIDEFTLAVKMAPHQPGLHEELGDQYWIEGQTDKAAAAYKEELEVDPYSAAAMYKLGSLEVLNGDTSAGVPLLRGALRADPSLSDAHYYLGSGLMNLNQDQEAIEEFRQAIAADPSGDRAISAYYKLAMVYRKLHRMEEAEAAMQKFMSMKQSKQAQRDSRAAQIVRKRTSLPVEDPEAPAIAAIQ